LKLNKDGKKPITLLEDNIEIKDDASQILNSDLDQMDKKYRGKGKSTKSKNRKKKKFFKKPSQSN